MKKLLLAIIFSIFLLQSCSTSVDNLSVDQEEFSEINLPKSSDAYGKSVATEIRKIVNNLNMKGYNFSKIQNRAEVDKFYNEAYKGSSNTELNSENSPFSTTSLIRTIEKKDEYTTKQKDIIDQIAKSYGDRKSDQDFKENLIKISTKVYRNIPKIEQDRLFNIIAVLYYGISEIQQLEKKGQIIRNNSLNTNIPRLKASNEGGNNETCRQEQSAISYVIGFISWTGEKVVNVTQAAAGALGGFIITWCTTRESDNVARCAEVFSACQTPGNHPSWVNSMPGTSNSRCAECLNECLRSNGEWKCSRNFRAPYN